MASSLRTRGSARRRAPASRVPRTHHERLAACIVGVTRLKVEGRPVKALVSPEDGEEPNLVQGKQVESCAGLPPGLQAAHCRSPKLAPTNQAVANLVVGQAAVRLGHNLKALIRWPQLKVARKALARPDFQAALAPGKVLAVHGLCAGRA